MNARIAGAVALLATLVPAGAVHAAANPRITTAYAITIVPLDAGYLVEAVCVARAVGTSDQVPVLTAVTCAIDDYVQTQAVPGTVATVTLTSAVTGAFALCLGGEALFLDPVAGTTPTVTGGPDCETVHP